MTSRRFLQFVLLTSLVFHRHPFLFCHGQEDDYFEAANTVNQAAGTIQEQVTTVASNVATIHESISTGNDPKGTAADTVNVVIQLGDKLNELKDALQVLGEGRPAEDRNANIPPT